MVKYLFPFLILVIIAGCKEKQSEVEETSQEPASFSIQDFPKIIDMETEVQSLVGSWPELMALESSFTVLKRATTIEDVKLAIDDLSEKEKALALGDYPETFDKLQIKSRQRVFRTFLLKVKANLVDNRDINESMEQMINSYNAFKNQFNVLNNSTLDVKLILDEEE